MKVEITVIAEVDKDSGLSKVFIGFPPEQGGMTVQSATHLLTSGVALLIKTCSKADTGIKDYELMKEVYKHLEEEFSSITYRDDTFVDKEKFEKIKKATKKRIYEENYTLLKDLKKGDVFLSKDNTESIYLKKLDDDKHLLKATKRNDTKVKNEKEYIAPHGNFPVFKKIKKNL